MQTVALRIILYIFFVISHLLPLWSKFSMIETDCFLSQLLFILQSFSQVKKLIHSSHIGKYGTRWNYAILEIT